MNNLTDEELSDQVDRMITKMDQKQKENKALNRLYVVTAFDAFGAIGAVVTALVVSLLALLFPRIPVLALLWFAVAFWMIGATWRLHGNSRRETELKNKSDE